LRGNSETQEATLGTKHRMKTNKTNTQHRTLKQWATKTSTRSGSEPRCSRRV